MPGSIALELQAATVVAHDAVAERQAEPGTLFCNLCCIEWLKDGFHLFFGYTVTCILNFNYYSRLLRLILLLGSYCEDSSPGHRINCIEK